jgi:hypothetical protein
MPEQTFTDAELDALADKLSSLEPGLSTGERALLAGVLHLTADATAEETGSSVVRRETESSSSTPLAVDVRGELPGLRDQFVTAFAPGRLTETGGPAAAREVTGTVGIAVRF